MLTAFTDDSGSDPKSKTRGPVFVMAGYLANTETWNGISGQWKAILDSPRKLEWFKSTGIQKRDKPPFENWELEDAELKACQLSSVIQSAPLTSFVFSMWWDDFNKTKKEFKNTGTLHPYDMVFHGVMASVTEFILNYKDSESVEFVFDEQNAAGERALLGYRGIKALLPKPNADLIVKSPTFGDDKDLLPLQMADMLAWSIRRYIDSYGSLPVVENGSIQWQFPPTRVLSNIVKKETLWRTYDYAALLPIFQRWDGLMTGEVSIEEIRQQFDNENKSEGQD